MCCVQLRVLNLQYLTYLNNVDGYHKFTISSHDKICKKNAVSMMLKQGRQYAWGMQNLSYIHISEGILCEALQILILTLQNDTHLDMGYHNI